MSNEFLSDEEVREITRRARPRAQKTQLDQMGIHSRFRADGTLLVLWGDVYGNRSSKRRKNDVVVNLGAV